MRYAQRGGYAPVEQEKWKRLRLEAAEGFERGDDAAVIAMDLRVTERTVRRWRKAWGEGGILALKSRGPVSRERLLYSWLSTASSSSTASAARLS